MHVTALDVGAIGAAAALVTPIVTVCGGASSRRHERSIARDTRLYVDLRDTYLEVLEIVGVLSEIVALTHAEWAPSKSVIPDMPSPERQRSIRTRGAVIGSKAVQAATDDVFKRFIEFREAGDTLDEAKAEKRDNIAPLREEIRQRKLAFNAALGVLEDLARAEVRGD